MDKGHTQAILRKDLSTLYENDKMLKYTSNKN